MKTNAERQAAYRKAWAAMGYKITPILVHLDDEPRLKAYAMRLRDKRENEKAKR